MRRLEVPPNSCSPKIELDMATPDVGIGATCPTLMAASLPQFRDIPL
jgi:hypothetical protein